MEGEQPQLPPVRERVFAQLCDHVLCLAQALSCPGGWGVHVLESSEPGNCQRCHRYLRKLPSLTGTQFPSLCNGDGSIYPEVLQSRDFCSGIMTATLSRPFSFLSQGKTRAFQSLLEISLMAEHASCHLWLSAVSERGGRGSMEPGGLMGTLSWGGDSLCSM